MIGTTKQDAILTEFRGQPFKVIAMADEIVRLKEESKTLRKLLGGDTGVNCCKCNTRIYGTMIGAGDGTGQQFAHPECYYRDKADRAERILAALREPSEAVLIATHQQLTGIAPRVAVIRAAVAAAEQEVERE